MANRTVRPTLTDVAARAGVSKSLVSLVMRGEQGVSPATRQRVREAADALGYQPDSRARLLRSGRSRLLGVVFGIEHAFHVDLVTALYTAARDSGYELALSAVTPERDETEATASLLQDRCEALIMLGPRTPAPALARLATRLPVVVLARDVRGADVIRTADADGLRQAVDHLAGLGHRRIAHIDGGRAPGAADRRRGYREAMHAHGLGRHVHIIAGGLTEDEGATAARTLLHQSRPPTAITVFNDRCATGVLDVLVRAGTRVPEQVSVVGFDDSHLARLAHISLTTIAQDVPTMTRLAVARAIERIDGLAVAHRASVVTPHLVIRSTTGPVAD
ncbi:LacI family DNA-binding transcriptional regulator [Actinoplanes nipponensis]|uniref:LacI family transcriptional regulator n=1 Tax=Actinoplanes nipponensis TaxID=135950 RepID=A0A919JFN8_9ACTN|nr:LacI family DNA-binding transcriptional regulator [Actinoplanes nipponensis]GIE48677.1 LacI family transcriptional regulator [Actinoplanes nipponensis]